MDIGTAIVVAVSIVVVGSIIAGILIYKSMKATQREFFNQYKKFK